MATTPLLEASKREENESDEENKESESQPRRRVDMARWNQFSAIPRDSTTGSAAQREYVELSKKIMKILVYIITFAAMLGCGILTKGSLSLMTSQLRKSRVIHVCNGQMLDQTINHEAVLPDVEKIAWYWCLLFAFMVPEIFTFFRAARICTFKSIKRPLFFHFLVLVAFETVHTIGVALLIYIVLPELDSLKGIMLTNCFCFIPGVLALLSRNKKNYEDVPWHFKVIVVLDIVAIVCQATGFIVWPIVESYKENQTLPWGIPLTLLFISAKWWENYVDKASPVVFVQWLGKVKEQMKRSRYFSYLFISVWKMLIFYATSLLIVYATGESVPDLFYKFHESFTVNPIPVREVLDDVFSSYSNGTYIVAEQKTETIDSWPASPIYTFIIHSVAAWTCYVFAKFTCQVRINGFGFSFPLNLLVPLLVTLLVVACGLRHEDACTFEGVMPFYLFWECPSMDFIQHFIEKEHGWVWIFWLLSQTWITLHTWAPIMKRLSSTDELFVAPMYSSVFIDQSLTMNRRREDVTAVANKEKNQNEMSELYDRVPELPGISVGNTMTGDTVTRIYGCATMWHETKEEMIEMLKSIFRMDADHSARKKVQEYCMVQDPDYYEFETHIFFDDAFKKTEKRKNVVVNDYVTDLIDTIQEAAIEVHRPKRKIQLVPPPRTYPTPYGGRLVWILPGGTKVICHLKNKDKIRHKKRWSQCMYMYYLLGFKLMDLNIDASRKAVIGENTYLLALDGDIDFQPEAVLLLVDLMKRDKVVGAACGRIHPVGSGPMVWYQKFEYAVGHWLQKATEHMIGCVLCSPGCFSLFRGTALMDDSVMKKYTTVASEPRHYVQYDQGEDRWLCTLLLQQGHRVEYSAASDAYTHCPEGFNEFYNQRRRWVPSTLANIMDLLGDYQHTVKVNTNISYPYIAYQMMLMVGTILGPGTIFMMLVGAFVAAFKFDNYQSFAFNGVPIFLFMIVCFFFKSKWQLLLAQLLSTMYALVMMAVLVGVFLQVQEDGILAPASISLVFIAAVFVITAILHPQEFSCLICGLFYYITVPSMYLLLVIFSVWNLDDVSWGTRETPKTKEELEQEQREAEESRKKSPGNRIMSFVEDYVGKTSKLMGFIKCSCCSYKRMEEENVKLSTVLESIERVGLSVDRINRRLDNMVTDQSLLTRRKSVAFRRQSFGTINEEDPLTEEEEDVVDEESMELEQKKPAGDRQRVSDEDNEKKENYWLDDSRLKRGKVDFLEGKERDFWNDVIEEYLKPLFEDKDKKKKIKNGLKELKNQMVFTFFLLNAIFVLVVFLLQLHKDTLHIDWPLGDDTNITFKEDTLEVIITKEYLELEPIGLVFVVFFAVILVTQFVAMLFHRLATLTHILAYTKLTFRRPDPNDDATAADVLVKDFLPVARNLQKLDVDVEGDSDCSEDSEDDQPGRRKTIIKLDKRYQEASKPIESTNLKRRGTLLDRTFKRRYSMQSSAGDGSISVEKLRKKLSIRRETVKAMQIRSQSIQRSRSSMQSERSNSFRRPYGSTGLQGITNEAFDGDADEGIGSSRNSVQNNS